MKLCSAIAKHNVAYLDMFPTRLLGLSMHLDDDVMEFVACQMSLNNSAT